MRGLTHALRAVFLVAMTTIGCKSTHVSPAVDAGSSDAGPTVITYYKDVKTILDSKCTSCHVEGGIGPFSLTTPENAISNKTLIAADVAARRMPPWLATDSCNTYSNDRSLSDAQIKTITSWVEGGAILGSPADAPQDPPSNAGMSRVDFELQLAESYTPQHSPDDYRCFLLDWPKTTTTYVTGFGIRPGDPSLVHHVVAFLVQPAQADQYERIPQNNPIAGYPCFGGPGVNSGIPSLLGVWAPGSAGIDFPPDTGIKMAPGSKVVLQIHYNTLSKPPAPDQSSLAIEYADTVTKPAVIMPYADPTWLLNRNMSIKSGDANATYSFIFDVSQGLSAFAPGAFQDGHEFEIYMTGLHMHWLGTHVKTTIVRASGQEDCLLDIPQWNFNWQNGYNLKTPLTFHPGDQLKLECHWDNSAANQHVVNGVQPPPHAVNWGDDSLNEMCMAFYYITQTL